MYACLSSGLSPVKQTYYKQKMVKMVLLCLERCVQAKLILQVILSQSTSNKNSLCFERSGKEDSLMGEKVSTIHLLFKVSYFLGSWLNW
jgi:hypothetical protein